MAVLPILLWPDPRLSQTCAPVTAFDDKLAQLVRDMFETMYDAPGRGLAGPQVGALLRVFVVDTAWKDGTPAPVAMINPEVLWQSEAVITHEEACLSIPGVAADISRPAEIGMRWADVDGQTQDATLTGIDAVCAQHELDHLDGKVIFDHLTTKARESLEQRYFEVTP